MKILVTGSLGQLGHEIMRLSADSEHEYIFTDVQTSGQDHKVCSLDIADGRSVMETVASSGINVIINCAAYTDVNRAESDSDAAFRVNALAVKNLADAALKADALLIHISTDYVFDGTSSIPYGETAHAAPCSVYGKSKLAGEEAIGEVGCRHIIFRTSWLYSNTGRNFFLTMADLLASKPSVKVVMDQVGTPTYAYDLAQLICGVIENGDLDKTGVYHYSDEGVCSWYDFAQEICMQFGYTCKVEPCMSNEYPSVVQRPHYSVMDKTKVKKTFGVEIPHWKESLILAVREYESLRG